MCVCVCACVCVHIKFSSAIVSTARSSAEGSLSVGRVPIEGNGCGGQKNIT